MPMADTAVLDELMANAWPPAIVELHGKWRFRCTGGVTRRANSALAVGGDDQVDELVCLAESFYRSHDAPALFQVSTASAPSSLIEVLEDRGYHGSARTLVVHARTSDVVELGDAGTQAAEVSDQPNDEWFDTYWSIESLRGRSPGDARVCRSVLLAPQTVTVFVSVRRESDVVGVGQLVIENGWAGVQCMATRPTHRRRGVAAAVLRQLAVQAAEREVEHLYLAVMADNAGARRLYERAGFGPAHEYRYFAA